MSNPPTQQDLATAQELGKVQGQLTAITQLLQAHHEANNKRMDDLQKAIDGRFDTLETRIQTLEQNERSTAIKAAASGATAAGVAMLLIEGVKHALKIGG